MKALDAVRMTTRPLFHVRWMIQRDIPEVLRIEQEIAVSPWEETDLCSHLRNRDRIGMVAEHDGHVLGFMVYGLEPDSITLIRMAVCPWNQRHGVGATMIGKLMGKLSSHRRRSIVAAVPEECLDVQLFLQRCRFKAKRIERSYDGDIFVMEFRL